MTSTPTDSAPEPWLEVVRRSVEAIRFGSVQIVVHEGRVTQVETSEKTRFSNDKREPSAPLARPPKPG